MKHKTLTRLALLVTLPAMTGGCLVGTAVGVAGDVAEGAVNVTGEVAEGAVKTTGAVVGAVTPGGGDDKKDGEGED